MTEKKQILLSLKGKEISKMATTGHAFNFDGFINPNQVARIEINEKNILVFLLNGEIVESIDETENEYFLKHFEIY